MIGEQQSIITQCTVFGGRDDINFHILAIVKSIGLTFGMSRVLILTFNATEHFFIQYKNKAVILISKFSFQYRNLDLKQKCLNKGCLIKHNFFI